MSLDLSFDSDKTSGNKSGNQSVDDLIAKCLSNAGDAVDVNLDGINVNCEASWEEVSKTVSEDILERIEGMGYVYSKYSELSDIPAREDIKPEEIQIKVIRYNNKLQKWVINKTKHNFEDLMETKKCYYFWKNSECNDATRKMMEHLLKGLDNNTITFTFRKS